MLFTASAGVHPAWRGGVTVKVIITRASRLSDKHSTALLYRLFVFAHMISGSNVHACDAQIELPLQLLVLLITYTHRPLY